MLQYNTSVISGQGDFSVQLSGQHSIPGINGASRIVLLHLLAQRGIDADQLCAGTDIRAIDVLDVNHDMPMESFEQLLLQALRLSNSPDLLLRYGQEISLSTLGVLGYAFMCCANLRELLELLLRYHRLLSPECVIRYSEVDDQVRICLHKGLLGRSVNPIDSEIFFSAATRVFQSLVNPSTLDFRVEFSHQVPAYEQAYYELFGTEVAFGRANNILSFSADLLEQPLHFADPTMKQIYQQQCEALLARLDQGRYSARVQQLLLETPGHFPGIDTTADRLKIGSRTLRRRLAAENTTYKQLVQDVRCQLAEEYLRDSPLSIQEIADMLGYSDVANFRRAFIAWNGHSPAEFRRQR